MLAIPSPARWAELAREFDQPLKTAVATESSPDEVQRKLETTIMDLSFENSTLEDIFSFLRDCSGLNFLLDAELRDHVDPERRTTFKVKSLNLRNALRLLLSTLGMDFVVTPEATVLLTTPCRVALFFRQN